MPTTVTAADGDSLCGLAIEAGFENCQPVRDANAGKDFVTKRPLQAGDDVIIPDIDPGAHVRPVDATHTFVKKTSPPVSIRFVHGSKNIPYLQDSTVNVLQVSNHITTKGGNDDNVPFPPDPEFHQPGHDDPDTFKVEVVDPKAGASVDVKLEALRKVVLANGTVTHDVFPGAEAAKRTLDPLDCPKVRSGVAYRSRYLRLVTSEADHAAVPKQTLLTTDMTDQGDPNLEILDQQARATYFLQKCPAKGTPAACRVTAVADVGSDTDPRKPRKRMKLAMHIVRQAPGGAPAVPIANADRRINKWFRRGYAQAGIAPKLVQATREVDPMENLVAISDANGVAAAGDGPLSFRVNAAGKPSQVIGPITPAAGDTPETTANALAALVQAPYRATPSRNAARRPDPPANRSADILITETSGARVTIDQVVSNDSRQILTVGRMNPANMVQWDGNNFLVGSIEERTALKNYDTGADRIDIVVITHSSDGTLGHAMMSGHQVDPLRSAIDTIKFSAFMDAPDLDPADAFPLGLPHECGHVAMELIHATGKNDQMMFRDFHSAADAVDGTKRIRELPQAFDLPAGNFRQVDRLHTEGRPLLDAF